MATDNINPFVLPGFGQSGDAAQNPLIASMEMMRNAWEGLAKVGGFEQVLGANVSPQDLEKRIADLRAVEQWLRMNLSMLSSTIQALEVQQATVSTLNSFLAAASNPSDTDTPPSPLEIALGIRKDQEKPVATQSTTPSEPPQQQSTDTPQQPVSGDSSGLFANPTDTINQASEAVQAAQQAQMQQAVQATQVAEDATKRWWGLLQNQFDTLAEAATATIQGVQQAAAPDSSKEKSIDNKAAQKTAPKKTALKKSAIKKSAIKKAAAKATTTTSKKTVTAKKTVVAKKMTTTKKNVTKKNTAKKTAVKKSAAKKLSN